MRKYIQTTLLCLFLISFTSCFEIREEVKMNADGSGAVNLTIDLSQSKNNLTNYMNAGEVDGHKIPSQVEIEMELLKLKNVVSAIPGMSEVKIEKDFKEFVFNLKGNFKDVKTLNTTINTAVATMNKMPFPIKKFKHFNFSDGKFSRLFDYTDERVTKAQYDNMGAVQRLLMESAKVISVYRFETPVKKVSNKKAKVSPSKKAVMLEGNIAEFVKGDVSLANDISF